MRSEPPRRVISDDQCIVVIDSSPIRDMAEKKIVPPWVETFAKMSRAGYSFSLGDATFAELLSQRTEGRLTGDYVLMIASLSRFLNPECPVLPGKVDIMQMIGAKPSRDGWTENEVVGMSKAAWEMLQGAKPDGNKFTRFVARIWWKLMSRLFTRPETLADMLQAERDEWMTQFGIFKSAWENDGKSDLNEDRHVILDDFLRNMDHGEGVVPSMTVRTDFQAKFLWRLFVRNQKKKDAYNPFSPKKRNDGIDFDFLRYLSLPAFFLAQEKGFSKAKIGAIRSFQTGWIWTPQNLADAWERGERPKPDWPA